MITDLTPENYFDVLNEESSLHVIMCYGKNCTPCKVTMPMYEAVAEHFEKYEVDNVKFHRFHQWEPEYKEFVNTNGLKVVGVPTFRFYFMGEIVNENARSYTDATELKKHILEVAQVITDTVGSWRINAD